jgi:hypothetical protein
MSRLRSTKECRGIEESIAAPLEKQHGYREHVMSCEGYQNKQCPGGMAAISVRGAHAERRQRREWLRGGFETLVNLLLMDILLDAVFQWVILGVL